MAEAALSICGRVLFSWQRFCCNFQSSYRMYLIEVGSLKLPSVCLATTEAGQSGVGSSTSILMPILACSGDMLADRGRQEPPWCSVLSDCMGAYML